MVVVLLVYNQLRNTQSKKEGELHKKSIAVLPFDNWSLDADLEPFCDAMTVAVISRLNKISSLGKIIPHTSVLKYKGLDKSAPEIASESGVTHILESSIQKQGHHNECQNGKDNQVV